MRLRNSAALIFCFLSLSACHFSSLNVEYREGKSAVEEKQFPLALKKFDRVIRREPESSVAMDSARIAAKVAHYEIKDFKRAIDFYSHLVQYSPDASERRDSQKKIAAIYFENLNDYKDAIEEYNKLLALKNSTPETVDFKLKIAKSNFYLNNFFQAESEVNSAIKLTDDKDKSFDLMLFLGNVYYNTKRVEEAIKVYEDLLSRFPERAKTENVAMNIIVCYEDIEQFDKAIERLQLIKDTFANPEFIDLKIKRLQQRKANLPGSRGLRK